MSLRLNMMHQFLIGSVLIVLCVVFMAVSQNQASDIQGHLRDWQSLTAKLEYDVQALQKQAQHYKLNAPRDFESYNRDLTVFYNQFLQQINTIEANHQDMLIPVENVKFNPYLDLALSQDSLIKQALIEQQNWLTFWGTFKENLDTQLGDSTEPRLEWGADHIISTANNVLLRLSDLNRAVVNANKWFVSAYESLGTVTLGIVLLILLVVLSLFAQFVVRPIAHTTRVASQWLLEIMVKQLMLPEWGRPRSFR